MGAQTFFESRGERGAVEVRRALAVAAVCALCAVRSPSYLSLLYQQVTTF